jgi:hypothetical protein
MEQACSPEFRGCWSELLTFQKNVRKRTAGRHGRGRNPSTTSPAASINEQMLEVRLTSGNACKLKYKHEKAAQDIREEAHCN